MEPYRLGTDPRIIDAVVEPRDLHALDNEELELVCAEIRAQINVSGLVGRVSTVNAVNEITLNEDSPKKKDTEYALRLYFADEGEKVWDISKRYNTSAAAIIAENELDSETASVSGMVLIPIV